MSIVNTLRIKDGDKTLEFRVFKDTKDKEFVDVVFDDKLVYASGLFNDLSKTITQEEWGTRDADALMDSVMNPDDPFYVFPGKELLFKGPHILCNASFGAVVLASVTGPMTVVDKDDDGSVTRACPGKIFLS